MGKEIDLLQNYPKTVRNVETRATAKTEEDVRIARLYGKDFFDGDRRFGYGGFHYNSRFWQPVVPTLQSYFGLTAESSVLDVGCAKGFMLYDFTQIIPGITIKGIDISEYAIENAVPQVRAHLSIANATKLPFPDKSIDVVLSVTTLHNLERDECAQALKEIQRVARKGSYITVDAYRNEEEKKRIEAWALTAKTVMSVDGWVSFFKEVGYHGDYFWFIP